MSSKKGMLLLKIVSDKKMESERFDKWRKFGRKTTQTKGEWTRQRLEFIRDFDTRVYKLGLKLISGK